jgi:predicted nucleic acid-binding protein
MAAPIIVLDTNILVSAITKPKFESYFEQNYLAKYDDFVISVVSEGELEAIASKRQWGSKKIATVERVLSSYIIYPIKVDRVIKSYAEIDTYSQGLLLGKPLPNGLTARNMGKNDLWIAATTHVLNALLVTTDKDFDHLNSIYFPADLIDISSFK